MGQERIGRMGAIRAPIPRNAWSMPPAAVALPPRAFVARTDVRDQGQLGSCTGFAFACALNILHGQGLQISPLALYFYNRKLSGFAPTDDVGAYMEPSARALQLYGAGSEVVWPYEVEKFATTPSAAYLSQAADHVVKAYYRATTAAQVRTALANGLPVVTSFDVPSSFSETGRSGVWIDRGGNAVGGHAVCCVGYDDEIHGGALLIQNSWGQEWGTGHVDEAGDREGFFWVPYDDFEGHRFWDGFVVTTWDMEAGS